MQNSICVYAYMRERALCEGDNLSVAKPGFPPRAPPIWADAFYLANINKLKLIPKSLKVLGFYGFSVRPKGWVQGGASGFATLRCPSLYGQNIPIYKKLISSDFSHFLPEAPTAL